jgi:hypothetical protein
LQREGPDSFSCRTEKYFGDREEDFFSCIEDYIFSCREEDLCSRKREVSCSLGQEDFVVAERRTLSGWRRGGLLVAGGEEDS